MLVSFANLVSSLRKTDNGYVLLYFKTFTQFLNLHHISNLATCNMDADCALREICDGARKLCVGKFYPSNFERIYFNYRKSLQ